MPSAAWFRQALETIGRLYRFVGIDDVRAYFHGGQRFNGACHVTFDDGDRTFVDVALPVLEAMSVPATLFVAPGVLASSRPYWFQELRYVRQHVDDGAIRRQVAGQMGWEYAQLAPCSIVALFKALPLAAMWQVIDTLEQQYGLPPAAPANISLPEAAALDRHPLVAIGAHSLTHAMLAKHDAATARREIEQSRAILEQRLGREIRHFAYPVGDPGSAGARDFAICRELGFASAVTTRPGMIFPEHCDHLLALPRLSVNGNWQEEAFIDVLLSGAPFALWNRGRRLNVA